MGTYIFRERAQAPHDKPEAQKATIQTMAPDPVRIRKHDAAPQTGSYEVCFADGRPCVCIYWTISPDGASGLIG
jgi:hypothetical protein